MLEDCNVNSASDAIKFSDASMQVRKFNTIQKLTLRCQERVTLDTRIYLQNRGGLPLQRHQAYGTLLTPLS